jgi:hypothetical protein
MPHLAKPSITGMTMFLKKLSETGMGNKRKRELSHEKE